MQHELAAGDSFGPARVLFEIGGGEAQPIPRLGTPLFQHGAHLALALEVSQRGTHPCPAARS